MTNFAGVTLSRSAVSGINWDSISKSISAEGLDFEAASERGVRADAELPADYPDRVRRVFDQMKEEFSSALAPLRRQLNLTLWILLPSLGISTIVGAVMLATNLQVAGGVVTAASVGTLFALVQRAWRLGKDQAILELIPQSYETLFALCRTPENFQVVFNALLEESGALLRHLREQGQPDQ
jgi:hypothetical protein